MKRTFWLLFSIIVLGGLFLAWQAARETSVLVEWSTASELDTVGFNLYRGENPDGPFTQINAELILASSDPLTGGAYTYQDHDVSVGKTYYYELEEVEASGGSYRFGPITVQAKNSSVGILLLIMGVAIIVLVGAEVLNSRRSGSQQREKGEGPAGVNG